MSEMKELMADTQTQKTQILTAQGESEMEIIQAKKTSPYIFTPTNFMEAMKFSEMMAQSSFIPKDMRGRPGDVFAAIQMGAELGLNAMQALQNVAVINGRPCIWGDAALAVAQNSPFYESHEEWMEGDLSAETRTAYCAVVRKGQSRHVVSFSMKQAKKAGLLTKSGPWSQYPDRMLQMRARSFAIRDKFADALKGLNIREEVEDYEIIKPNQKNVSRDDKKQLIDNTPPYTLEICMTDIMNATDIPKLKDVFAKGWNALSNNPPEDRAMIKKTYDKRKTELEIKSEAEPITVPISTQIDGETSDELPF